MKELVRGIKINIIGNLFRFSRTAFFIVAAVLYGTELFGVYTIAWASAELLNRYGMLGLEHGMLFELAHFQNTGETRKLYQKIASSLKACLFVSLLGALGLTVYTYIYVDTPLIRNSLFMLIPIIPLYNVGVLLIQATMGLKEMKYHAIIRSGIEPLAMLILLLVFWKTPLKPYGIILAQGLALILVVILSVIVFRRFFSWREVFHTWRRPGRYVALIKYSLPMYIIEAVDTTLYRIDIFLISAFLGVGSPMQIKLLGVYGFAKQIARVITQTKNAFVPIFVPVSSESYLRNDTKELWDQVRFAMEKLFLLNIAFGLFLAAFGKDILLIVGKDASLLSGGTFLCLLGGQFVYSTFSVIMFFLVTTQHSRFFLIAELLILGIAALVGSFVVQEYYAFGAAATVSIGYGLIMAIAIVQTLRFHSKDFMTGHTVQIIIGGCLSALLIFFIKSVLPTHLGPIAVMIGAGVPGLIFYFLITTTLSQWRNLIKW
jgi:O-antigen/teichoic acid export membrane protein